MSEEFDFGIIYLACPYSGTDTEKRHRVHMANASTALLFRSGLTVISPLTHNAHLEMDHGLPAEWLFWKPHCLKMLQASDSLVILTLPGWDHSIGVHEEYMFALDWSLPVFHARPEVRRDDFSLYLEGVDDKSLPSMVFPQ